MMKSYGQHHAKREPWTFAKSVDPDQPPRLRLFETSHINGSYISYCVNILIKYRCFQHLTGADLGLRYVYYP